MSTFKIRYTGDYLNEQQQVALGDIKLSEYDPYSFIQHDFLRDQSPAPGEKEYWNRLYSLEVTPEHIANINGLVIFRPWVKPSVFAKGAENLTVIGRAGAGFDKIDMHACTANDVAVYNTPDTLTHSTASSAFLLILAVAKRLVEQERMVRDARWDLQAQTMGVDLPGKTLGIVGLGASGRELARLMAPWNMRIIAYSPRANPEEAKALGVTLVPTLEELLRTSDFVSLHNRLTADTRNMIGEKEFRTMKKTASFINVARGEMVQQDVMVKALREKWIASAGLDVYEHEPLPAGDPLIGLDNVTMTPHWLPSTYDAAHMTMTQVAAGMIRAAQGLVPENIVNKAVLERPGFQAKLARFVGNRKKG